MKLTWHANIIQHLNQVGFAITVCFLDPGPAPMLPLKCDCGAAVPLCIFELTVLVWTLMLVAHREEQ
jgi:hypothetical protein